MGQHKKSKSWSALISFPAMLTPSSSSGTRQSYQPTLVTNPSNGTENQDSQKTQRTKRLPTPISMKKSSSQQQYPSGNYDINNSNDYYRNRKSIDSNDMDDANNSSNGSKNNKSYEQESHDDTDGTLVADFVVDSLPLFYLFSSDALADEKAKEDTIIPFMEPTSLALDQATLIAGVLESLVRVVDDIPTGISDDDSSSGNITNDTEHEDYGTDSDDDSDNDGFNEPIGDGSGMSAYDMDCSGGNGHLGRWTGGHAGDDTNDMVFGSESSSPDNLHPSPSTSSSTRRSPYMIPSYTESQQQPTSTQHIYPRPSTSTLSTFSSSTSSYTRKPDDHHHNHHCHSKLVTCPFTIIGLGAFKVALWPSVLQSCSDNQDLNLVVLVSPTYPDHDIIEIMYKMEKSLKHTLTSVLSTTIDAQLIGQHLIPLVRNSFTVV